MFIHYRTRGFIIKKEDRGEADQLFTIYTKDSGKLEILGKSIRKISSKLRSGAEIFYLSEIEFIQGKTHKTLTDAIPIEKFKNIGQDLRKLKITYKISEVLDNFLSGQEPDEKIWQLLTEIFQRLNTRYKAPDTEYKIYYYFLWNLLSILGYQPELQRCSLCQKKLVPQKLYFSLKEGGAICQDCFINLGASSRFSKEVPLEIIKILRVILNKEWQTLSKLKIEPDYLKSLKLISQDYLFKILETIK